MPGFYAPRGSDLPTRLMAMSVDEDPATGCREWNAGMSNDGYGQLKVAGKMLKAHRVSYETFVGPIPEGMVIDHLCFNRACINPGHLRVLTVRENNGNKLAAHLPYCAHGHEYTPENTFWYRRKRGCRTCARNAWTRRADQYNARRRAKAADRRKAEAA